MKRKRVTDRNNGGEPTSREPKCKKVAQTIPTSDELWSIVFSFCSNRTLLLRLSLVSSKWKRLIDKDDQLWRNRYAKYLEVQGYDPFLMKCGNFHIPLGLDMKSLPKVEQGNSPFKYFLCVKLCYKNMKFVQQMKCTMVEIQDLPGFVIHQMVRGSQSDSDAGYDCINQMLEGEDSVDDGIIDWTQFQDSVTGQIFQIYSYSISGSLAGSLFIDQQENPFAFIGDDCSFLKGNSLNDCDDDAELRHTLREKWSLTRCGGGTLA